MTLKINSKWGPKEVLIDDEDYNLVKDFDWKICKSKKNGFEVYTDAFDDTGKKIKIYMSEIIMKIYRKTDFAEEIGLN